MYTEKTAISNGQSRACFVVLESRERSAESLADAARAGDSMAFATLCERYSQQFLRAANRVTRNREDAEDAVQDALLNGFVHVGDFDGRSSFATWLTRITINSALMILRKKRSSHEIAMESMYDSGAEAPVLQIVDRAANPERRYAQGEEQRILKNAIQRLRPPLREAIQIQHLQERSLRETARVIGISIGAVKGRLFHAKAALRKSSRLRRIYQPSSGRKMCDLSAA